MTVLQNLINKWETEKGLDFSGKIPFDIFISDAKELLELEKKQIINAYIGYNSIREKNLPFAEQYYNEKYNNSNK